MRITGSFLLRLITYLCILSVSFYSFISCLDDATCPTGYELLCLLPLSFAIMIFLLFFSVTKQEILNNIPNIIIITLLFLRNVITPLVMVKDSYVSSLGIASATNARTAIILTVYESIAVFIFLILQQKIKIKSFFPQFSYKRKYSKKIFWIITIGMLFICFCAVIFLPELRTHYFSVFTEGYARLMQEEVNYRGSIIIRILGHGGDICIGALRYTFPLYIIYALAKRKNSLGHFILSLFLIFTQSFYMTSSNAYILMLMVSQVLFLASLYPKYQKGVIIGASGFGLLFLGLIYINRFALNHYSKSFSLFLQSYIPSVANTAGIFNVIPEHNFLQFFSDFIVAMPFKNILFGYEGGYLSINTIWQNVNNCSGQILSNLGESYYYFGGVFSPTLTIFFIYIANKIYIKMKNEDNVLMYGVYIYIALYATVTPFMYNGCIFMKGFFQRIVFMLLVAYFCPYKISSLSGLTKYRTKDNRVEKF